jgi:FkbM family methyltransferase
LPIRIEDWYKSAMFEESYLENSLRWHIYRRWKRRQGAHRVAERAFYQAALSAPKGSTFLDLGANVGVVSAAALKIGLKVIAFEPDPTALASLRRRFEANPNVEIIPKAVGASARTATFYRMPGADDGRTASSSLVECSDHEGGTTMTVEVIDLIEFLKSRPTMPSIVKMDIEGSEAECLEAVLDAGLQSSIGAFLVETHDRVSTDIATRLDRIRARIARGNIQNINLDWV